MHPLPSGQTAAPHEPFGLVEFGAVQPQVPAHPVVTVTGAVRHPTQFATGDLTALPNRVTRRADLHCVTTWSALDLTWQGVPFADVHAFLKEHTAVRSSARWISFTGLDGYRATMLLDDALRPGVLLADTLDGTPLDTPRLVAPAHYGYKSVKHVCAIEYLRAYEPGSARWKAHPRGRVALEERSRYLPGRVWRLIWHAVLPRARAAYSEAVKTVRAR